MKNWKKVKLGTLLTESKVVSVKPNPDKRIRVKLNVLGVKKRPITKDKKGATKYYLRKAGQFVYGKQNLHKGAFGIVPDELDGFESSLDIPAFDINESCYPEWIFYFFKKGNFYLKLESLAKGVGSKRIHPKQIFELDIFLPSKEEQRKVLDEIEIAEKNNQELVKEIVFQEENLSKLRNSILQDAIKGKLTKVWRTQNTTIEVASELLKKIKVEKNQLIKERKIRKEKLLAPISKDEIPFEIPETWKWCRFQDLYNSMEAGKSPKCLPYPADENQWGVIKISAISWGYFQENENKMLPLNLTPFVDKEINAGDFILTRANTRELIARSVIVEENVRSKLLLNDKTLRINLSKYVNKDFLNFSNISPYARNYYWKAASGTSDSMKNISRLDISSLFVPLPPINEQNEIVKKINQLLGTCSTLELEINNTKTNSEKMLQSVLSKLLGEENKISLNKTTPKKETKKASRETRYNSKTLFMDLVKLLKENGKLHAEDLWKMSQYPNDIDAFYSELKMQIEDEKSIKEVANEKGYLELA